MSSSTREENFLGEISSLRHTMRDLVALSALPVIWTGYDSERIAESLADVMLSIPSLELIYITFARKGATAVMEVARCSQVRDSAENRIRWRCGGHSSRLCAFRFSIGAGAPAN